MDMPQPVVSTGEYVHHQSLKTGYIIIKMIENPLDILSQRVTALDQTDDRSRGLEIELSSIFNDLGLRTES
jgi:hypothetical protein